MRERLVAAAVLPLWCTAAAGWALFAGPQVLYRKLVS